MGCHGGNIYGLPFELSTKRRGTPEMRFPDSPSQSSNPTDATLITFAGSDIDETAGDYSIIKGGLLTYFMTFRTPLATVHGLLSQKADNRDPLIEITEPLDEENFVFASNDRGLLANKAQKAIDLFNGQYISGGRQGNTSDPRYKRGETSVLDPSRGAMGRLHHYNSWSRKIGPRPRPRYQPRHSRFKTNHGGSVNIFV